jgi:hypothetical protein
MTDIVPIIKANCTGCHNLGGMTNMAIYTYLQATHSTACNGMMGIKRCVALQWKLDSAATAPMCGNKMPKTTMGLTAANFAAAKPKLEAWANAGCPNN